MKIIKKENFEQEIKAILDYIETRKLNMIEAQIVLKEVTKYIEFDVFKRSLNNK